MNVSLSPELEHFVQEKVRAGQYQTVDDMISSALSILRQQEILSAEDIDELRREITLGIQQLDRGESASWDAASLKEKVRRQRGGY